MTFPTYKVKFWTVRPRRFEIQLSCGHWQDYASEDKEPPARMTCHQCEPVTPIVSDEMYQGTLQKIYKLMDAAPGSDDERELIRLAHMVELYEAEHYPMEDTP